MPNIVNISQTNTFEEWRVKNNEINTALGDLTLINSNSIDGEDTLIPTINHLRSETTNNRLWIGSISSLYGSHGNLTSAVNTAEGRLVLAENAIGTIGNIYNSGSLVDLTSSVNEVFTNLQNVSGILGVAMSIVDDAVAIESFNTNYDGDDTTVVASLNDTYARLNKLTSLVGGTQTTGNSVDFAAADLYGSHTNLIDAIQGIEQFPLTNSLFDGPDNSTLIGALNTHESRIDNHDTMVGATTKATFKTAFTGGATIDTTLGALNDHESRLDTEEANVDALQVDLGTWSTYEALMTANSWTEGNVTDAIIDIRNRQDDLTTDFIEHGGDTMTGDLSFNPGADIYGKSSGGTAASLTIGVNSNDTININNSYNIGIGKEPDTITHDYLDDAGATISVASWKLDVNGTVNASNLRIAGQQLDDRFQPRTITDGVSVVTDTVEQQGGWASTGKMYIGLGTEVDGSGNFLPLKVSDPDATTGFTFTEFLQDTTGGMFTSNSESGGISAVYSDATGKITLAIADDGHNHVWSNIDGATDKVQDIVGAMITSNTESGINVTYQESDGTVDFNTDDFEVKLSGDVAGAATVTNLANINISTTIQPNSVALGTDTTGDYVYRGATSGSGISGSTSGETKTFTVTSNATTANTANTIVYRDGNKAFNISTINANNAINVTKAIGAGSSNNLIALEGTLSDIAAASTDIGIQFKIKDGNNVGAVATIRNAAVNSDSPYGDNDESAANLVFSATNAGVLADHVVITGRGDTGFGVMDPQSKVDIAGDLRVSGSLIISGSTTTINSETVNIADNIIVLNSNVTGTPTENGGFEIERGTTSNASLVWKESGDYWLASHQLRVDNIAINANTISSTNTNGNLVLSANGSGVIDINDTLDVDGITYLDNMKFDGNTITTTTGNLVLDTAASTGVIDVNANMDIDGNVYIDGFADIDNIKIDANTISTTNTNGSLTLSANGTGYINIDDTLDVDGITYLDNMKFDGNTISSTNTNGNINLNPNGTGAVDINASKFNLDGVTTIEDSNLANGQLYIGGGNNISRATLTAGNGIDITNATGSITVAAEIATDTNTGVAKFSTDNFSVSSGNVTIKNNGVILGTETTGNYVKKGATSGSGISGSIDSEGGTFTVSSNATNLATANTLMYRDGSANFKANTAYLDDITLDAGTGYKLTMTGGSGATDYSGIKFNSGTNAGSDFGFIYYRNDTTTYEPWKSSGNTTNECSELVIGTQNDTSDVNGDILVLKGTAATVLDSPSLRPPTNNSKTIGTSTYKFAGMYATTFYGNATSANYADLAENYLGDNSYEVGTVLSLGGPEEVTLSATDGDRKIIGIVSENPAYLMNAELEGEFVTSVALTGRVPCKVSGSVKKGDMMVSDGTGRARAEEDPKMGSVIGKALEDSSGDNIIEVVVGKL